MLNKLVLHVFLSLALAFSFAGAANATLITQDIISEVDGVIGNISINIDNAQVWDINESYVENFEQFQMFGVDMLDLSDAGLDNIYFNAYFNPNDLLAGIHALSFDIDDVLGFFAWAGEIWDSSFWNDPLVNENTVDVFDGPNNILYFANDVTLGQATVDVPAPATLVLFLTALMGLVVRQKNS